MIENSLKQAGVKIENAPVEKQLKNIVDGLKKIIPIKIETKKIRVKIPPQFTGQSYGLIQEYKEKEDKWVLTSILRSFGERSRATCSDSSSE
jgi:ribosome maturation protein Sdo1